MKNSALFSIMVVFLLVTACKNEDTSNLEETRTAKKEVIDRHDIERIEPPNWWVGFKNDSLQLMVHHQGIAKYKATIEQDGLSLVGVNRGNNSDNYLFLDLVISEEAQPGMFNIRFSDDSGEELIATYELKERQKPAEEYVGFDSSDAIYLITPDRFANGKTDNDSPLPFENQERLKDVVINRNDDYARHGGDIQGVIDHLDYVHNLGFTALWPQPLLTNDMQEASYHGYAITDYYQIDPRFGTLDAYQELSQKLKTKNMKLIMDQVANHCGLEHWWMKDLPFKDWVNHQSNYEANIANWSNETTINSNHRRTVNQDRYASVVDKDGNSEGWFVATMPDLNQRNPYLAKYLIQNSIWWIETAQLDGIRQDTYPYPDKQFMSDWAGAIMTEYPNFNIVGEEWSTNPLMIGYWQDGQKNNDGYDSNLRSTMDFAMQERVVQALKEEEAWNTGLVKLYEGLANDFHYVRPEDIMVFPDNHDMSRIFTQLDGDITHTKMALATYAVLPRIFQMYYGTEILMNDFDKPGDHGLIRTDFPGGWGDDKINAFSGEGLSGDQKEMQKFVSKLLNYRKNSKAIHKGKTIHFAPYQGVYILVRKLEDEETVVLILNKNSEPIILDLDHYKELGLDGQTLRNVLTDQDLKWSSLMEMDEQGVLVLTTKSK